MARKKQPKNTNCLEGMACPECKSLGPFKIAVTSMATVTDDGTDEFEDIEWDDGSYCRCIECENDGIVENFKTKKNGKKE
jgi:hypothetical protein